MALWNRELDVSFGGLWGGGWCFIYVGLVWACAWWVHCDWWRVGVVCLKGLVYLRGEVVSLVLKVHLNPNKIQEFAFR